jgi:hypothetical protein
MTDCPVEQSVSSVYSGSVRTYTFSGARRRDRLLRHRSARITRTAAFPGVRILVWSTIIGFDQEKSKKSRCAMLACQFTDSTISCRTVMEFSALAAEKAPLNCR